MEQDRHRNSKHSWDRSSAKTSLDVLGGRSSESTSWNQLRNTIMEVTLNPYVGDMLETIVWYML